MVITKNSKVMLKGNNVVQGRDVVIQLLNERTILVVDMGNRLEPVVDTRTQELLFKNNENYEDIKETIMMFGYDVEEIVLESEDIERLKGHLEDYYAHKDKAFNVFARLMKDYIREEDLEYLKNVDPITGGAYLLEDEDGVYIETDISKTSNNDEGLEVMTVDKLEKMSSKELVGLLDSEEDEVESFESLEDFVAKYGSYEGAFSSTKCNCEDCDC